MKFRQVNKSNIAVLYNLNIQLATDENQKDLFTANKKCYTDAFLNPSPISHGFLAYDGNDIIGFYIYFFKFASYSGTRVLYVEDMYLTSEFRSLKNKRIFLKYIMELSNNEKCSRVEMRVLKSFNFGYDILEEFGFRQINKWDVYRFEPDF